MRCRRGGVTGADPVLIVDHGDEDRRALSALLSRAGYETREATTGEDALAAVREERPALVVLEVSLPDSSGYTICRQLRDEFGDELPIIFVSRHRTESYDRMAGLLIGADEYLAKPCVPDEFLLRVGRLVRRASPSSSPPRPAESTLTARELEILGLLVRGLAQKEIAAYLHLSPKTVNSHLERVYEKLGVHSRTQAVTTAIRMGLVDLEPASPGRRA